MKANFNRRSFLAASGLLLGSLSSIDAADHESDADLLGRDPLAPLITNDFCGGNISLLEIKGDTVFLEQELRDSTLWFYWNFLARGFQNREMTFHFTKSDVVGIRGACKSRDLVHWEWTGEDSFIDRRTFRYRFGPDETDIYFAFSFPYQVHHFESFYAKYHSLLNRSVLCLSEKGRAVPIIDFGSGPKDVFFLARSHACEASASYVLEGVIEYLLTEADKEILKRFHFHVVPFVDIDGVEAGDQGKNRKPHDHNRDYGDDGIYKTPGKICEYLSHLDLLAGTDFHSPNKWGGVPRNDHPFIVKNNATGKRIDQLIAILHEIVKKDFSPGMIAYDPVHTMPPMTGWNREGRSTGTAAMIRAGAELAFTLEFPYFGLEVPFTQSNSRLFGRQFAKALEIWLAKSQTDPGST